MTDAQRLHAFFSGAGTDHAGRTIEDYPEMSNETLEQLHDYIQWAFPTRQPSQCQPSNAPLLSDEAIELLNANKKAMGNYYAMFARMISFYTDSEHWLVENDHNHLRITRIIESSAEIFDVATAEYFLRIILRLNTDAGDPVNKKSVDFWLRTVDAAIARNDPKQES
ncbi:hypothetical protein LCGC14_2071370 [marine sediment metagenome]|uniref:Opioid growth factor receptor (OGFr) conserved domain-containing protein n=1 Tax=marine sediment metagenome TaxID=412755 RepID=A0A0F9EI97_9ZZZZ